MERRENETVGDYYNRLNQMRDEFLAKINPLIREAKVEASRIVNVAEIKRRAERDLRKLEQQ